MTSTKDYTEGYNKKIAQPDATIAQIAGTRLPGTKEYREFVQGYRAAEKTMKGDSNE